jgi:DNA-directed RNA polymerase I subunit RPA1
VLFTSTSKKSKANGRANGNDDDARSDGSSAEEDNEMPEDESVQDEDDEEEDEADGDDDGNAPARTASGQLKGPRGRNERVMAAAEVRGHLRRLFTNETELCSLLFGRHGSPTSIKGQTIAPTLLADMFFMDVIPVPPTRFRPASKMNDELFENAQNSLLSTVISTSQRIQLLNQRMVDFAKAEKGEIVMDEIIKVEGQRAFAQLLEALIKLQHDVNSFMDSSKNPTIMRQGKLPPPGVKQLLEKKEGLFRKHMMVSRLMQTPIRHTHRV